LEALLPIAPRLTAWVRTGFADRHAQTVSGYIGVGAMQTGTFASIPDDRPGFAIAHAIIGPPAVATLGISRTETSFETSYQLKLSDRVAIQPAVQYIAHPAGIADAPNGLGVGLRFVFTTGSPRKAKAVDPTDPTVPPGRGSDDRPC
jgi:porin